MIQELDHLSPDRVPILGRYLQQQLVQDHETFLHLDGFQAFLEILQPDGYDEMMVDHLETVQEQALVHLGGDLQCKTQNAFVTP